MSRLHPLRSVPTNASILDLSRRLSANQPHDDIEDSVATVAAVGEMLDRMQTQLEKQAAQIVGYQKEVRDLVMHKEAAYSEMTRAEAALRAERERADRAERMCQQLTVSEGEAHEKIKRLIVSVRTSFARADMNMLDAR